jgi:hypothetical protein
LSHSIQKAVFRSDRKSEIGNCAQNARIIKIWKSMEEWDTISKAIEKPAYAIAGRSLKDQNNRDFFCGICQMDRSFSEQNF